MTDLKRILFVDDESNVLESIRRTLHADSYRWELSFSSDPDEALRMLAGSNGFDVIVSDMLMPRMSGAELLNIVRERFPNTARLVLSGFVDSDHAILAIPVAHQLLQKPCERRELRCALERVCTLQDILSSSEIRSIVGSIDTLPSPSRSYQSLLRAVQNPFIGTAELGGIIEKDIAMSAKLLQLVNSAFFGLPQHVVSIDFAIRFLGIETVKRLALTSGVFGALQSGRTDCDTMVESVQERAWRTVAIVNMLDLAEKHQEAAVLGALLHDVGQIIIASKLPNQFRSIQEIISEEACSMVQAETRVLGVTHAEIGAYLLGLWGLDSRVVEAVAHHHHPTRIPHTELDSSSAVYLADLLFDEIEEHPDDTTGSLLSDSDKCALTILDLDDLYSHLRKKLASAQA